MKLNYGSGEHKLEGYVNIDMESETKPDLVCDLRNSPLPFPDESVESIVCTHNLEHIELKFWPQVFSEFWRVMKADADIYLAYPEFEKCAMGFLENRKGMKDFFRATLYGRQFYSGDYHVVPMHTPDILYFLTRHGFKDIVYGPEVDEDYNTFLIAHKGPKMLAREDILRKEIFQK